jgi:hypothetical protein
MTALLISGAGIVICLALIFWAMCHVGAREDRKRQDLAFIAKQNELMRRALERNNP